MSSLVSSFVRLMSSLSLLRKGLFTCVNFVDCIIFSMSSSNSFDSSIGGGFLVDLAVCVFEVGGHIKVEEEVSFPALSAQKLLGFSDKAL